MQTATRAGVPIDAPFTTVGLTNVRTRIVGNRTGFAADALVLTVRFARGVGTRFASSANRLGTVTTALGWFVIAFIPTGFYFGYGLGWTELVVAAWAALVALGLGSLYLLGTTSLVIDLRATTPRVVVGDSASAEIAVRNPSRTRLLGARVEIPVGNGLVALAVPSLSRDGRFSHSFPLPTTHRGVVSIGPVRSIRADPLGLLRRELAWTGTTDVFVHPKTVSIRSMSTGFIHDLEGNPTRDLSAGDMAFHALREYQPGDERRSIHWKSTARTGRHMVRQFEETRRSHLLVALSLASADYLTDEEFEMAVSVTASLGARAIRDTRDVTVVVSESTPDFAIRKTFATRPLSTVTPTRLLDDLAVVDRAPSALGITDVARVTADSVFGVSIAFLVCGSPVTVAQLRSASIKYPVGVEVVAIVCDPGHVPAVRKVAGLTVFTIGFLDDLRKSLARSAAT